MDGLNEFLEPINDVIWADWVLYVVLLQSDFCLPSGAGSASIARSFMEQQ